MNFYLVIIESFGGFWGKKLLNFGKFVPNLHNHKFEGKKNPGHKGGPDNHCGFCFLLQHADSKWEEKNVESASCTLLEDLFAKSQPEKEENFNSCQKALLYFI